METSAAEKWIYTTLAADTALTAVVSGRIFNTRRPAASILPCCIFQLQAPGVDFIVVGGARVWSPLLYLVTGLAEQASYEGVLATIADRIDAVLSIKSGTNVAGTVHTCLRERAFQFVEIQDGREYRRLGGIYRIQASKA